MAARPRLHLRPRAPIGRAGSDHADCTPAEGAQRAGRLTATADRRREPSVARSLMDQLTEGFPAPTAPARQTLKSSPETAAGQ